MDLALSRRLGQAFNSPAVTLQERERIRTAAERAETFDDLPPDVKQIVLEIEERPGR